jgi:hypothetical protein
MCSAAEIGLIPPDRVGDDRPAGVVWGALYTGEMLEAGEIEMGVEVEEVDAIPVCAPEPARALIRSVAPTAQAAAVAAGGFMAGAAVVGLASRRRGRGARALAKRGRRKRRGLRRGASDGGGRVGRQLVQIVGTRSLLVDVHLLDGGR